MLAALAVQRQSSDWTRDNGQYIPERQHLAQRSAMEDEPSSPGDSMPFRPRDVASRRPATNPTTGAGTASLRFREWHAVLLAEASA